jgi:hypothetical protein
MAIPEVSFIVSLMRSDSHGDVTGQSSGIQWQQTRKCSKAYALSFLCDPSPSEIRMFPSSQCKEGPLPHEDQSPTLGKKGEISEIPMIPVFQHVPYFWVVCSEPFIKQAIV